MLGAGVAGAALWWLSRRNEAAAVAQILEQTATEVADTVEGLIMGKWSESKIPAQYLGIIRETEQYRNMPRNMLARLLWQESRYNPNAYNSSSGATGMAQFTAVTLIDYPHNPYRPEETIPQAGAYLRKLYDQFGDWKLALAAYNWGPGNVKRKGLASAPKETRNYYSQILGDLGMA